ncbi:2-oxoacid:ferredoxin oxidoreductase subunit beta [Stomatohabitans albus]|uniref:2-oxoacid:ferredoxin oxidoreductase subunit beta n=1 Tax=Stomatohabitans albus TaxID=3110766 RepID=UPI00300D4529
MSSALEALPMVDTPLKAKDFATSQEVRWCPGCGDYSILAGVRQVMADLGIDPDHTVVISGIGCSSRFPYYMNTYGMHSIHGRAPAIATGLAVSRPDLAVFVVTGDGDALSIGGNHLIHALRRNVNMTILLFNNQIYGLTKGQYSPTSRQGATTKSTPFGSLDRPFNPVSLALGAGATFVARTVDSNRKHLVETITAAAHHPGTSLVEIAQNCPIFNDGAFERVTGKEAKANMVALAHGEPAIFGLEDEWALRRSPEGSIEIVARDQISESDVFVHDVHRNDPTTAFALSQLDDGIMSGGPMPIGVFRQVIAPTYCGQVRAQVAQAGGSNGATDEDIQALITGSDTWTVSRTV